MITNKDIRVENGFLIINGDKYPLDGQSPEAIMAIVKDNSDTTPTENSTAPITSGGVFAALAGKEDTLTFDTAPTAESTNPVTSGGLYNVFAGLVKFHSETHSVTSSEAYTAVALDTTVVASKRQIVAIDFKRSSTYYSFDVLNVGYQLSDTSIVFQNNAAMSFGGSSTFDFRIIWAEID